MKNTQGGQHKCGFHAHEFSDGVVGGGCAWQED